METEGDFLDASGARRARDKIVPVKVARRMCRRLQETGRVVVFTNAVFDLLGLRHIRALEQAASFGDFLIVGINSDISAWGLKKSHDLIQHERVRAEMVAALWCVRQVVIFPHRTASETLEQLKPQVYCKGPPWNVEEIPEAEIVRGYGGRLVQLDSFAGPSTSELLTILEKEDLTSLAV